MIKYNIFFMCLSLLFLSNFLFARDKGSVKSNVERISTIKGANIDFYKKYEENRDNNSNLSAKYAILFLENIDSNANNVILAEMNSHIANYYSKDLFLFSKAKAYEFKALKILERASKQKELAESECSYARLNVKTGNLNTALPFVLSSLKRSRLIGDSLNIRNCYNVLGNIYFSAQDFEKAGEYYREVATFARTKEEYYQMVIAMSNLSLISIMDGKITNAKSFTNECIALCNDYNFCDLIFEIYNNIISMDLLEKNMDSARVHLDLATKYADNICKKGLLFNLRGMYSSLNGDSNKAIDNYNNAIDLFNKAELDSYIKNSYFHLYKEYKKIKEYDKALIAFEQYCLIENKHPKSEILLQLYQTQNEINMQKDREQAILEKGKHRIYMLLELILFIVIIACLLYYYVSKKNKDKTQVVEYKLNQLINEKAQMELTEKQKEMERELNMANEILKLKELQRYQENVLIDDLIEKLTKINNSATYRSMNLAIMQVINEMRNSKDKTQWQEMEAYLPGISSTFFDNLSKEFPNLTVNERRLCAFLHMNMTTKEISALTKQSINSITIARFRLRKKLNLTSSDISIISFLRKFD